MSQFFAYNITTEQIKLAELTSLDFAIKFDEAVKAAGITCKYTLTYDMSEQCGMTEVDGFENDATEQALSDKLDLACQSALGDNY